MPSWRVHVFIGASLSVILLYAFYHLDLWYLFISENQLQFLFFFHCCFIGILGSVAPDFDYRNTRIRHALGPCLGLFIIISYVYINLPDLTKIDPNLIIILLIAFFVIPFLFGLVFPFRHHGKLHSISAACLFVLIWMCVELLIFKMSIIQTSIIGLFGFVGYSSHLLLDLDLKLL